MNVPLERTIKVEPARHVQKGRFRTKQRKQAVKSVLREHLQRKDLTLVDVSSFGCTLEWRPKSISRSCVQTDQVNQLHNCKHKFTRSHCV